MRLRDVTGLPTYYAAATVARVGDEMVAFALVLLVLDRTGRPALAGLTGAAYGFPAVLTGPLLGTWLDRTTHRRTALALNQAVLGSVMLTLLATVGHTPAWVTPALAVLAGVSLPMVSGGFTSMLPALVPGPLLARANAIEAASFGGATITGPALAATLAATVSVEAAVATIAVTAAISIAVIARLPVLPPAGASRREPFVTSVAGGLMHLVRTPPLRSSTIASTLAIGVSGVLLITLPLHVAELGASKATSGYVWTAIELGSVITVLLTGRLLSRYRPERTVLVAVALYGLAMLTWPLAPTLTVLLILALLTGLLEGAMMPAMLTARQIYSPPELQGRVSTTAASLRLGVMALGQAAAGLTVPHLGTHTALLFTALALVAASALAWMSGRQLGESASSRSADESATTR